MKLWFVSGCVVAYYAGRYSVARPWDGISAVRYVLNANAALGVAASATLADLPQQDTSLTTG